MADSVYAKRDSLVLESGKSDARYWSDLWHSRELLLFLSWRDVLVRYKQTALGIAWSLLRPALTMIIFSVLFGNIAKMPSDGAPYPILVLAAMLPWQLFAGALSDSGQSVVANSALISKVYFPRMVIPGSAILVNLVDFAISLVILAVMMVFYGITPTWRLIVLPVFLAIAIVCAFGVGLIASALNVRYRDFRYIMPFLVQIGMYVAPVGFSSSVVPERWRLLYSINPMVGVIDGFRWALINGSSVHPAGFALSIIATILILIIGVKCFRRTERAFADVI